MAHSATVRPMDPFARSGNKQRRLLDYNRRIILIHSGPPTRSKYKKGMLPTSMLVHESWSGHTELLTDLPTEALLMFFKNRHSQRSFSQCGEDLIVKFFLLHSGLQNVRYLDIGANHPWKFNNTALLYIDGSRGVNIEPDPDLFSLIKTERKEDINLNVAIDSKEGEVDFFLFEEHTMNTINKAEAEKNIHERNFHFRKSVKIKALTLTTVIDTYFQGSYPEFLSIDAEGTDETIVQSLDPSRVLPRVICIETVSYSPNITGTKNPVIFSVLQEKGYRVFADTYVNTIFVRDS